MGGRTKIAGLIGLAAVAALAAGCGTEAAQRTGEGANTELAGALPGARSSSCVEEYEPQAVSQRAFAFDGSVTGIAAAGPSDELESLYVPVTFAVNEWFHGGEGETVTVDMVSPRAGVADPAVPGGSYAVGSRLLVSGEPRWGGHPLKDAVAWTCGFTRYYGEATADAWRTASR